MVNFGEIREVDGNMLLLSLCFTLAKAGRVADGIF